MNDLRSRVIAPAIVLLTGISVLAQAPATPTEPAKEPAASPAASIPAAQPAEAPKRAMKPVNNPPFGMFKDSKFPMIQRSVLNNATGRIDRMAVDLVSNRLYVAARSNGSIEMLEVATSKQQPPIAGLAEPSGVLVASDQRKLVVSCSGDNTVQVFTLDDDGAPTFERTIKFEGETDAIRYDPAGNRVYVGHGRKLGSFNLATGERGPSLELPGMPEGFLLDPGAERIYVNIAQAGVVAVVQRSEGGDLTLETAWTLKDAKGNYPMALDPASGHLFVLTRNPSRFVLLDTKSGQQLGAMECTEDADDCWWDAVQKRIYVSAGGNGGYVDVFEQTRESGKITGYTRVHQERTNVGCRTSVFVPEQRRLFVVAPQLGTDPTFVYVFLVGP
jgi:6-phosphogluconolactonase (cycloisomerase 2 family)